MENFCRGMVIILEESYFSLKAAIKLIFFQKTILKVQSSGETLWKFPARLFQIFDYAFALDEESGRDGHDRRRRSRVPRARRGPRARSLRRYRASEVSRNVRIYDKLSVDAVCSCKSPARSDNRQRLNRGTD